LEAFHFCYSNWWWQWKCYPHRLAWW